MTILLSSKLLMQLIFQNTVTLSTTGADPGGGGRGPGPPLTTKNEAPAPKFYKTEAPGWQF